MNKRVDALEDWSDFEPTTDRERMAYALMVAGICEDDPDPKRAALGSVALDYGTAENVLEELEHRGFSLAMACEATSAARADHHARWETFGHVCAMRFRGHGGNHQCRCGCRWVP